MQIGYKSETRFRSELSQSSGTTITPSEPRQLTCLADLIRAASPALTLSIFFSPLPRPLPLLLILSLTLTSLSLFLFDVLTPSHTYIYTHTSS